MPCCFIATFPLLEKWTRNRYVKESHAHKTKLTPGFLWFCCSHHSYLFCSDHRDANMRKALSSCRFPNQTIRKLLSGAAGWKICSPCSLRLGNAETKPLGSIPPALKQDQSRLALPSVPQRNKNLES